MKICQTLLILLLATFVHAQSTSVGASVYGDFNGDGIKEYAFSVQTERGIGNAVEDGTPGTYAIYFSTTNLPEIQVGCCEVILINEGDLNGDGADDISLYQAPMNGTLYSMETVSFTGATWQTIVPSFLIPTGGVQLSKEQLQDRIYSANGIIYYLDTDVNDENQGLIRKQVD